jgi:diketogulonate reductase-like aldo/keto reductase
MAIGRRTVLQWLLGSAAAVGLNPAAPLRAAGGDMRARPIPSSGKALPVVGLGTWQQFDVGPSRSERAPLERVLKVMYACGGRVVDSSPMYGRSEQVAGDLAAKLGWADALFMATKVWTRGRQSGIEQMKRSMRRMHSHPMDLMQVHNLKDWRTHLETLRAWKKEGHVRYIGVTHYRTDAFDELERILKSTELDFVQLPFSLGTRATEDRLLPLAADRGVAVLVNRPYEGGSLFHAVQGQPLPQWARPFCDSWAQFFLKYILAREEVTCVIPGTSDPEHARDNMGAGSGPLPDAGMRKRMVRHMQTL